MLTDCWSFLSPALAAQENPGSNVVFLTRVVLRNNKSIAFCDLRLGPLTFLVGPNGSGKSNFLDALHFVRDSLNGSLENALNERGGLNMVRRLSSEHPATIGIRLEFQLSDNRSGHFAFSIGISPSHSIMVMSEECRIQTLEGVANYSRVQDRPTESSELTFPAVSPDRLALVSASGFAAFRPVYDALTAMVFYNIDPKPIRELQKPQDSKALKPMGENIASVIGRMEKNSPESVRKIQEYLQIIASTVNAVRYTSLGPMETLSFLQNIVGSNEVWHLPTQFMSDGTLRALGVLTALFQGDKEFSPLLVGIEEPETGLHPAASVALREAMQYMSEKTQVIVTSHSPELLNDAALPTDCILAVVAENGRTRIAPLDSASREALKNHLFTAGELLLLNQLIPDPNVLEEQNKNQADLFGESQA